jgi:hypothetical protein
MLKTLSPSSLWSNHFDDHPDLSLYHLCRFGNPHANVKGFGLLRSHRREKKVCRCCCRFSKKESRKHYQPKGLGSTPSFDPYHETTLQDREIFTVLAEYPHGEGRYFGCNILDQLCVTRQNNSEEKVGYRGGSSQVESSDWPVMYVTQALTTRVD